MCDKIAGAGEPADAGGPTARLRPRGLRGTTLVLRVTLQRLSRFTEIESLYLSEIESLYKVDRVALKSDSPEAFSA